MEVVDSHEIKYIKLVAKLEVKVSKKVKKSVAALKQDRRRELELGQSPADRFVLKCGDFFTTLMFDDMASFLELAKDWIVPKKVVELFKSVWNTLNDYFKSRYLDRYGDVIGIVF